MLNNALHLVENFGFSKLTAREERTMIKEVMGKIHLALVRLLIYAKPESFLWSTSIVVCRWWMMAN